MCFAALISAVLIPSAQANDWNRKTVITFSAPVEIPGVHLAGWGVLPAGTYVFKLMALGAAFAVRGVAKCIR
jgi:hypothetical protein